MDADQFQDLYRLLSLATVGITLFLAMVASCIAKKDVILFEQLVWSVIIFVFVWIIAIIIWAIVGTSFHALF